MLDKEINTPCRQEEFQRICSDENLVEKAQEIEVTIPVKKVRRHCTNAINALFLQE